MKLFLDDTKNSLNDIAERCMMQIKELLGVAESTGHVSMRVQ
jgi:hypothetical protein